MTLDEVKSYLGLLLGLPGGHLLRNSIPIQDLANYVTPGGADELQAAPGGGRRRGAQLPPPGRRPFTTRRRARGRRRRSCRTRRSRCSSSMPGTSRARRRNVVPAAEARLRHEEPPEVDSCERAVDGARHRRLLRPVAADRPESGEGARSALRPPTRVAQMTSAIASYAQKAGNPLAVVAIGTAYQGTLEAPRHERATPAVHGERAGQDGVSVDALGHPLREPRAPTSRYGCRTRSRSARRFDPGGRAPLQAVHGQAGVVLTFNLNNGIEYWQIEESNWTDAPLLAKPTATFTSHGRTYEEFTSGGAIQTIAVFARRRTSTGCRTRSSTACRTRR